MRIVFTGFFVLTNFSLAFTGSPSVEHKDVDGKYKVVFPSKPKLEIAKGAIATCDTRQSHSGESKADKANEVLLLPAKEGSPLVQMLNQRWGGIVCKS